MLDSSMFKQTSIDETLLALQKETEEIIEEKDIKKVQIEIDKKTLFITNDPSIYHSDYDYDTNVLSDISLSIFMRLASVRASSDKFIQFSNEKIAHDLWKSKVRTEVRKIIDKPTIKNVNEKMESLYSESINRFKRLAVDFDIDFGNLKYLTYKFGQKLKHLVFILKTNKYLYE